MAKAVGLSRKIKLQWLNKAVDFLGEGLTEDEYKEKMNEYLSFEIKSPTVLRKTREILMHVWFYDDNPDITDLRRDAAELIGRCPDYDAAIHWCMLMAVYPVFADICKIMGRIAEFNDIITLSMLKRKLYDEWGERSTLCHSADKIIATVKELGAIRAVKPGSYAVIRRRVNVPEAVAFMLRAAMKTDGGSYYSFMDLNSFDALYPFEYTVSGETLMSDGHFVITSFGGEMSAALRSC